ncbi:hypothetical protein EDD21DRAFT_373503 [Dissophora ornata]|nr:hypothetical protein EDD21DRAFT_373503 [Dissophora ornata]
MVRGAKARVPEGSSQTIQEIESDLPPLRGPDASMEQYVQQLEKVERHLNDFYNSSNRLYQSHAWDARRAREEEYLTIASRLLKLVGGSIGEKRKEDNMVVIAIGLGQFRSTARLTTLHNSFQAPWSGHLVILLSESTNTIPRRNARGATYMCPREPFEGFSVRSVALLSTRTRWRHITW